MKINAINIYNNYQKKNIEKTKNNTQNTNFSNNDLKPNAYPSNYYLSFNGILCRNIPSKEESSTTNKKLLYALALSDCNGIIPDLVEFITLNKKYSNIVSQINARTSNDKIILDFINNFFKKYPQYEEEYNKAQNLNLSRYIITPNTARTNYFQDITRKINTFLDTIEKTINAPKDYPNAVEILEKIANVANPLFIKNNASNKDFNKLLSKYTTPAEMKTLSGSNKTAEYNKLIPEGMKDKIRSIIKKPEYINLSNAAYHAIIQELMNNNIIEEKELLEILSSNNSIDKELNKILTNVSSSYKVNQMKINENYNKNKLPLNKANIDKIKQQLLMYNIAFNETDKTKLNLFISKQGNYLNNAIGDNPLAKFTQIKFWNEFDSVYGTNYSDKIAEEIKFQNLLDNVSKIIEDIDLPDFDDFN